MAKLHGLMIALGLLVGVTATMAAESEVGSAAQKAGAPESFQIRNKKFGDLLRPEDANSADGTRIVLYPMQSWKCMTWKFYPAGDSVFQLQNHFTSKTFAPTPRTEGSQVAVVQVPFAKESQARPAWRFTRLPDGLYQIIEVKSGKALAAVDSAGSGVRIVLAPVGGGDDQKWELLKTDPSTLTM
jgi:hypothetical protein